MPTRTADAGLRISAIDLDTRAQVPGINEKEFLEQAELAKNNCAQPQNRLHRLSWAAWKLSARFPGPSFSLP